MRVRINGEAQEISDGTTVAGLLAQLQVQTERVAVERNRLVVRRGSYAETRLEADDEIEILTFVGRRLTVHEGESRPMIEPQAPPFEDAPLTVGKHVFRSRLIVGTGKYRDFPEMQRALAASGSELVTVALRRVDLSAKGEQSLFHWLPAGMKLLPNTAGCFTADEAIRTCRLARELSLGDLVKLEVIGDQKTLFPDVEATLAAARVLVKEGFTVMPYITDDPVVAKRLEEIGCAAVMPLAAPIGSGLGIRNPYNIAIIREQSKIPVIVDAGVGTASDAAVALELGCDGVLMNTAIALARDPVRMAHAMRLAIEAGRQAFLAGRMPKKLYASASSPLEGLLDR